MNLKKEHEQIAIELHALSAKTKKGIVTPVGLANAMDRIADHLLEINILIDPRGKID